MTLSRSGRLRPGLRLLVSVADATDARCALEGGADLIDAKDPLAGALGAVSRDTLESIHAVVAGRRPVTAALGDAADEATVERAAFQFCASGAELVKIGFSGISDSARMTGLIRAGVAGAQRGAPLGGVVAVAYADAGDANASTPFALVEAAVEGGAMGVLLDTADKRGPGIRQAIGDSALAAWIAHAHEAELLAAVAGKLSIADLPFIRDAGADIAGVRGAACDGGRGGRVSIERVGQLHRVVHGVPLCS